ncbi:MAG TPA: hypothetical protein VGN46_06615 [Luteibacter sp.]|jgi:hypothetical protein
MSNNPRDDSSEDERQDLRENDADTPENAVPQRFMDKPDVTKKSGIKPS